METLTSPVWTRSVPLRALRVIWHISTVIVVGFVFAVTAEAGARHARLSSDLNAKLNSASPDPVEIILTGSQEKIARLAQRHGLTVKRLLASGAVFSVTPQALGRLADDVEVDSLSGNGAVHADTLQTTDFTGADAAWAGDITVLGPVNGSGIGVAVIDSGIDTRHPALVNRVIFSADFTDPRGQGEDLYGHGTHVAGIIAARSYNNSKLEGTDSGMAPAAHLVNLKVLDANGNGTAADVIEAIDFAVANRGRFAIRVINLSLGTAPTQSYKDDPICQAVERAVKAGIVVVVAAGNHGQTADGKLVYGSITSPGISPYAITVGALRTQGTADPSDDEVAPWSSKGPTLIDHIVKPDLVAPGSKIVSTISKDSTLALSHPQSFMDGPGSRDYFSMSGTSMAAAVVSGAAALLLDGASQFSPMDVKLTLQSVSQPMVDEGALLSGAGSLNLETLDATRLSAVALIAAHMPWSDEQQTSSGSWSVTAGGISTNTGLWGNGIVWGAAILWGDRIVWGDGIVWGASNGIVWGASKGIVWGASAGIVWGASSGIVWGADGIVWGADGIVWGADGIVWGADGIVWGADGIVWGADGIVWGADGIVWGADGIVWGADGIVWGADGIVWGASPGEVF